MGTFSNRLTAAAALLAIAMIAMIAIGCSKKSTPTAVLPPGLPQDAADDLALQAAASLDITNLDIETAVGAVPAGATAAARPTRTEWDTTFTRGSLTFEGTRTFLDGAGAVLPDYGPTAVRMFWTSHVYGTVEFPRDTATVIRWASLDLRGIQPAADTIEFEGGVFDTLTNRFRSYDGTRIRYSYWTSYFMIENMRLLKSSLAAGAGWPISGQCTFDVSADRLRSSSVTDVEIHYNATVVVTFNGTSQPDIVVNGIYRYKWNLLTGQVARA